MSRLTMLVFAGVVAMSGLGDRVQAQQNWPDTLFGRAVARLRGGPPRGGGPAPVRADEPADRAGLDHEPPGLVRLHQRHGERIGRRSRARRRSSRPRWTRGTSSGGSRRPCSSPSWPGPEQVEIGLGVSSLILSDVVLNPGSGRLRDDPAGARPPRRSWRSTGSASRTGGSRRWSRGSKALTASLQETKRVQRRGRLSAHRLPQADAPAGFVRDEIRLMTNDPRDPRGSPSGSTPRSRGDLSATPSLADPRQRRRRPLDRPGQVHRPGPRAPSRHRPDRRRSATASSSSPGRPGEEDDAHRRPDLQPGRGPDPGRPPQDLPDRHRPPGEPPIDVAATLHVEPLNPFTAAPPAGRGFG